MQLIPAPSGRIDREPDRIPMTCTSFRWSRAAARCIVL